MKTFLCLILFTSLAFSQQEQRFQIIEVDNVLRLNERSDSWLILKIDTKTGNVWYLSYVIRDSPTGNGTMQRPEWLRIVNESDAAIDTISAEFPIEKKKKPVKFDFSDMPRDTVKRKGK